MTDGMPTVESLVARVENRNRRFKVASVVFGAVLTAGLALLLIIALNTLQRVNTQLVSLKKLSTSQSQILTKISGASVQRTAQINDLQQHIDCVVELFQQPNRASLTITDLEGCKLSTVNSGVGSAGTTQSTPSSTVSPTITPQQITNNPGVTVTPPNTLTTPVNNGSSLDRVPVLGRVFRALGL